MKQKRSSDIYLSVQVHLTIMGDKNISASLSQHYESERWKLFKDPQLEDKFLWGP